MSVEPRCQQCGAPVAQGALFCAKCGAEVTIVGPAEAATVEMTSLGSGAGRVHSTMRQMLRDATLGEYEILDELGRGGMATVFLAHDIALDRKVAIKVMAPHLLEGEGMAERFKLEARTAAQLSHPHIIPIYAVKETESSLFFVMKYVEGRPLDEIIKKMGPMPIAMVKDILTKVGSALGYAHRRDVIHRDVKPANVMIDEEGNPIMTDFGIAKVAEAKGLTMTGTTIGTPSYMSPEQCEAKEVTGASDQYSLGIVGWEMLTGKVPFAGDSAVTTMYKQVHEELPPLLDFRPDVPPEVLETVTRMLEKSPANRWPSLEAAIRKLGSGTDPQLDPIRNQLLELARDTDPSELLAQLRTPGASLPSVAKARTPTPTPTAPRRRLAAFVVAAALVVGVGGGALAVLRPWEAGVPATGAPAAALDDGAADSPSSAVADGSQDQLPATPASALNQGDADQAATITRPEPAPSTLAPAADGRSGSVTEPATSPPHTTEPPSSRPQPARVASVRIVGAFDDLEPGDEAAIRADALDAEGTRLSGRTVRWTSSDRSVGEVGPQGTFRANAAGSTVVTAEIEGVTSSRTVDVSAPAVASLALDRASLSMEVGERGTLSATAQSRRGRPIEVAKVVWKSSDPSVATVGTNGEVTAAGAGQTTITASADDATASAQVTVMLDTRTAIEQAIAGYARALESRDITAVKAAYPGMTAQEESDLIRSLPSMLSAQLHVDSFQENGDAATAAVSGTYTLRNGRRQDRVEANIRATFERRSGRWVLTQMR